MAICGVPNAVFFPFGLWKWDKGLVKEQDINHILSVTFVGVVSRCIFHQLRLFEQFESFQICLIAAGFYEKSISAFGLTCIQEEEVLKAWTTPHATCVLASPPFATYSNRRCGWIHHCWVRGKNPVDGREVKPVLLDPKNDCEGHWSLIYKMVPNGMLVGSFVWSRFHSKSWLWCFLWKHLGSLWTRSGLTTLILWIVNFIPLCQMLNKTLGVQPLHMVNMEDVFPLGL